MQPAPPVRPVLRGLRALLAVASVLVIVAAIQLFVLSSRTADLFAWTVAVPLTAAVDGAFYLAAFFLLFPATRMRTWVEVRPMAWGIMTVASLKLAATLLHLSKFHLHDPRLAPRVAAWGWLIVHIVVPIALAALIVAELRLPGTDPGPSVVMPAAFRWTAGLLSGALVVIGAFLLLAPSATAPRWPWPLTPLTAQALSAWFIGLGVLGALAVRDGDLRRTRYVWTGTVALCVFQGAALARFSGAFDRRSTSGILYVALLALVGAGGVWGWVAAG